MRRITTWFVVNVSFMAALWFGHVEGVDGAKNLATFWTWFSFTITLFYFLYIDKIKKLLKRPTPAWLSVLINVSITAFFVWHAYYITGFLWLIRLLVIETVWAVSLKADKNNSAD